jgi:competence protein ComGC
MAQLSNESGQTILETMLLLLISIVIILSVLYQFNSAFRVFASNFFGEYIACLIETGDLPGVSQECQSKFMAFNLKDGKKLVNGLATGAGAGGTGSTTGSTSSSSNSNGKGGNGSGAKGGKSASSSGSNGSSGSSDSSSGGEAVVGSTGGVTRGGRGSSSGFLKIRHQKTSVGTVAGKGGGDTASGKGDSLLGVSATSGVGVAGTLVRERVVPVVGGYWGEEEEKQRSAERPPVASMGKSNSDEESLKPKKAIEKGDRAPAKQKEMEDKGFSAGELLRILLIVGIVIIILVFFGGQAMQISKSWEK